MLITPTSLQRTRDEGTDVGFESNMDCFVIGQDVFLLCVARYLFKCSMCLLDIAQLINYKLIYESSAISRKQSNPNPKF